MTTQPQPTGRLDPIVIQQALVSTGAAVADAHLLGISEKPLGIGQLADSLRLTLTWARTGQGPDTVVAKVPAHDPKARQTASALGAYDRECRFYAELAPLTRVTHPAYLGTFGVDGEQVGLLLEDLSGAAVPADQFAVTDEEFERARAQLAILQASTWMDTRLAALPWLHRRLSVPIPGIAARMRTSWESRRAQVSAEWDDDERAVVDQFVAHCEPWALSLGGPSCLVHHDFRIDNLLYAVDRTFVLDWQTVGWGPAMFDLAYLVGTSLTPTARRVQEPDIVRRHVDDLATRGVTWSHEAAWAAYRQAGYAVLLMLVPPLASVKQTERGQQMLAHLVRKGAQQARDLGAGLEGSTPGVR